MPEVYLMVVRHRNGTPNDCCALCLQSLHQLHPQLPSDRLCGTGKGPKRDRLIVGIEQPIKLGATRFHALGKA